VRICETRPLHLVTYGNGMAMQESLVKLRQSDAIPDQLLLLEHPPVITLGRGGDPSNLIATADRLAVEGVEFTETTRGGDITYHGPGQLVGYPIIHLGENNRDIRKYVTNVEEVLIRTVAEYGIKAARSEGDRGVWVGNDKIAAIGVRIARWVTSHGFALNIAPDFSHFALITPCGLKGKGVTSIERLTGKAPDRREVERHAAKHFAEVFDREMVWKEHDLPIVKAAIHTDTHILLLKRTENAGGFWQPITGRIEKGETPLQAAVREVREETAIERFEVEDLGVTQSFLIGPEFSGGDTPLMVEETAFAVRLEGTCDVTMDEEEHTEWGWFTFAEASEKLSWSDDKYVVELIQRKLSPLSPRMSVVQA
jgi:lipoyl(octanoyl) transferase